MVRNAEDFLGFTRARVPDPETGQPDPEKVMAFIAEHPETANALQLGLPKLAPTTSFATSGYNGLHAFGLVDADGNEHWGRYQWHPLEGEHYLRRRARGRRPRLPPGTRSASAWIRGQGRVQARLRLAAEGDSLTDPTEEWKGENEVVTLGKLTVTDVIEEPSDGALVFDPNNLTDGIVPSDDKILAARSPAYSRLDRAPDGVTDWDRLAKERYCYLTTMGRVSGRPREIEIWFALMLQVVMWDSEDPGSSRTWTVYMLAEGRGRADWVRNLLADPRVTSGSPTRPCRYCAGGRV